MFQACGSNGSYSLGDSTVLLPWLMPDKNVGVLVSPNWGSFGYLGTVKKRILKFFMGAWGGPTSHTPLMIPDR